MLFCNPAGCLQPSEQKTEKPRFFGRRRKAHSRFCERAFARPKADSMGRPVWNRTYSAVIPCIRVQPPTASSHIGRIKKGMARPFPHVPWYSITPIWKMQQVFSKKFVKKPKIKTFFRESVSVNFRPQDVVGGAAQTSDIRRQKSDVGWASRKAAENRRDRACEKPSPVSSYSIYNSIPPSRPPVGSRRLFFVCFAGRGMPL